MGKSSRTILKTPLINACQLLSTNIGGGRIALFAGK
jgi:hypothetical protein